MAAARTTGLGPNVLRIAKGSLVSAIRERCFALPAQEPKTRIRCTSSGLVVKCATITFDGAPGCRIMKSLPARGAPTDSCTNGLKQQNTMRMFYPQ
jgi:hypothetical protein